MWTLDSAGYLMSAPLTPGTVEPPAPYATRVVAEGGVVVATVLDAYGRRAASGRLAGAGEFAIVDQVETVPGHRRRGLGSVVMAGALRPRGGARDAHGDPRRHRRRTRPVPRARVDRPLGGVGSVPPGGAGTVLTRGPGQGMGHSWTGRLLCMSVT
jgi:hypothetical protein